MKDSKLDIALCIAIIIWGFVDALYHPENVKNIPLSFILFSFSCGYYARAALANFGRPEK